MLSIVFGIHVVVSFAAFFLLLWIVVQAANGLWWFLGAVAVTLWLPACLGAGGLHLWRKTRYPWLAIIPALISVAMVVVPVALVAGWGR